MYIKQCKIVVPEPFKLKIDLAFECPLCKTKHQFTSGKYCILNASFFHNPHRNPLPLVVVINRLMSEINLNRACNKCGVISCLPEEERIKIRQDLEEITIKQIKEKSTAFIPQADGQL